MTGPRLGRAHARLGPSSLIFAARALGLVAGVATVLITARALGADGRGQVATFAVLVMISSTILGFGMGVAAYSLAAQDGADPARLARALLGWAVGIAVVSGSGAMAAATSGLLEPWLGSADPILGLVLGVGAGFQFLAVAFTQLATGMGRPGAAALGLGLPAILVMASSTAASIAAPTPASFMVAQVAGWGLATGVLGAVMSLPLTPSANSLGILVRRAGRAALGETANALSYRLDILLLGLISGSSAVGIYSFAVQVLEPVWIVPTAASNGLLLRLRRLPRPEWRTATLRTLPAVIFLTAGGAAVVVVCLPIAIEVVGPQFSSGQLIALGLAPGIVMLSISKVLAGYHIASGRLGLSSAVGTISVLSTTAFDLLLMPRFGALGASIASSLGYGLSMILWTMASRRRTQIAAHAGTGT